MLALLILIVNTFIVEAQENQRGFKTTMDITIDNVGSGIIEVTNKYNAAYWDYFTKSVGNNTSIINNQLKKTFPKYHLSDFSHSQNANERSNTVKFKIDGMMNINKNGKWEADLERKDPDITKVSNTEFLLIDEGESLKIHLPSGTSDAKVEKNSFGKAILTYTPATGTGLMGNILRYLGIAIGLVGIWLLIKNRIAVKAKSGPGKTQEQIPVPLEKNQNPAFNEISKN